MSTKVTFNVCEEDMEYARSVWNAADYVLNEVNRILQERGIEIQFDVENHGGAGDMPEEFWNEEHPDYNSSGIVITETVNASDIEDFGA